MMRTTFEILLCLVLALLPCGCGGGSSGSSSGKLRLALIPKGTSHDFWKAVELGARRAEAELGDVEFVWKGPSGEGDDAGQIRIVESFIANAYDGICLAPLDARALEKPVQQSIAAGIPVLIFDSALASAEIPIVSFVATDNYHGGQMAGEYLAKLLGGKGRVIVMPYQIGSHSTMERERGCLDALAKYPGIEILSKDKHAGPSESTAIEVSENLIDNFGDKLDGIFTSNESNVSGLLTVLRRDPRGLAGKIKVVGFDSGPIIVDALEKGHLHGTIVQDPVRMGYEAVKQMAAHLRGEEVPKRIPTGETLITPENRLEPRNQELLFPLGKR